MIIGLGLASEGIVRGNCSGWFLCGMGEPGKHTSPVNTSSIDTLSGDILLTMEQFQTLSSRFAVALNSVQFSFRRFKLCADIIIAYLQQGHRHQQFLPVLIWGMGCRDP